MVSISAVISITMIGYLLWNEVNEIKKSPLEKTNTIARVIAEYCAVTLVFNDSSGGLEILEKMTTVPNFEMAAITTKDNILFTSYGNLVLIPGENEEWPKGFSSDYFFTSVPITYKSEHLGELHIVTSLVHMKNKISKAILIFILIFLSINGIIWILAIYIQRFFTDPILLLSKKMENFSFQDDINYQFPNKRKDEIGILIKGFNDLISELVTWQTKQKKSEKQLLEINENLEELVAARTNELTKSNDRIKNLYRNEKHILQNVPWGIALFNPEQNILEFNTAARKSLGFFLQAPDSIQNICDENEVELMQKVLTEQGKIFDDESITTSEAIFYQKDGTPINVLRALIPIEYYESSVVMIAFVDISNLKQTELDLLDARDKAEKSDRLKSSFLANMSHEIRTPLNAILGFSQILSTDELDPVLKNEYQGLVERNSNDLLNLIDDILDISKLETNNLKIIKKEFYTNELKKQIEQSAQMMLSRYGKDHLNLNIEISNEVNEWIINNDRSRLNQILNNLLNNAIKFTKTGTISVLFYSEKKDQLYISVLDTGKGIPQSNQPYIFDRFYKLENNKTVLYGGTGLGLAICKQLTLLMDIEIGFNSKENIGSEFFLRIPRSKK